MRRMIVGLAAVAAVVVGGGLLYLWLAGGSGAPTTDLTTPPIAVETTPAEPPAPDESAATASTTTIDSTLTAAPDRTFVIDQDGSTASFALDEELRGVPTHVVGLTNQVAGQLRFDPSDLASAAVSPIVVNARTFQTDSATRDRAIRGPVILDSASDEFELITFEPKAIEGLEGAAEVGDTLMFAVVGDLTIKGVTLSVTFDVDVTWTEETRLDGTATSTVDRTEFGIGIPNVASVANVTEEVDLTFSFAARAEG